jgi:hypothetical protein
MQVFLIFMTDDNLFAIHLDYAYKRHSYGTLTERPPTERPSDI